MAAPRKSKIEQCLEEFGAAIDQHQETVQEGFTALIAAYDALDAAVKNGMTQVAPAKVAVPPAAQARPTARPAPAPVTATRRPAPPVVEEDGFEDEGSEAAPVRRPGRPPGSTNKVAAAKPSGRPAAAPASTRGLPSTRPAPEPVEEYEEDPGFEEDEKVEEVTGEDKVEDWEKEWQVEEDQPKTTRRPTAR